MQLNGINYELLLNLMTVVVYVNLFIFSEKFNTYYEFQTYNIKFIFLNIIK